MTLENPQITLDGVIDVTESTPATPVDDTPATMNLLLRLAKSGRILTLRDVYDSSKSGTVNSGYYRLHSLDGDDNCTDIDVMINGLSFETSSDVEEGQKIVYTVEIVEVNDL